MDAMTTRRIGYGASSSGRSFIHRKFNSRGILQHVKWAAETCIVIHVLLHICALEVRADASNGYFRWPSVPFDENVEEDNDRNHPQEIDYNYSWSFENETIYGNTSNSTSSIRYEPPKEIVVGYITSLKKKLGALYIPPGQLISGAITYAVKQINDNPNILPNTTLKFVIADTHGEETESLYQTAQMIFRKIHAIIGPQETCVHEARLAAAYNVPMISYVSILLS